MADFGISEEEMAMGPGEQSGAIDMQLFTSKCKGSSLYCKENSPYSVVIVLILAPFGNHMTHCLLIMSSQYIHVLILQR